MSLSSGLLINERAKIIKASEIGMPFIKYGKTI